MLQTKREPMTALDYAFMIGGPLAFLAIAVFGIMWLIGPAPPENPIGLIKAGKVRVGMSTDEVRAVLGSPKSIVTAGAGVRWEYHHGTADPFVEEEADLTFSPTGALLSTTISRSAVPQPAEK